MTPDDAGSQSMLKSALAHADRLANELSTDLQDLDASPRAVEQARAQGLKKRVNETLAAVQVLRRALASPARESPPRTGGNSSEGNSGNASS